ncbi:tRNA G18 (ribose-2'-O)-methylase SpoU [Dietzia kunjamensis subsp. schimae]|uniref:RNA methyltransferase n=2 Tax=Dietzia TaxID=37914 RepID=A0AAE4QYP6_9ACTN|nr:MULTISPECIES: RNA methyltransferase [Dietzia]MVZ90686.1 RNA methyltransferase [Microbacter sp. ANSKLAB05]ODQ93481.1 rRNA methyltransferase [Dietzia alimentaria]MCY1656106.1 RNA methyltransferase [Dietzia sp. SL131]MCZ4539647.1 RNA methyltransferase [Dietzia maris]MDJ0422901.1 RNA methyltransferase [Dietzia kunjamensis]
MHVVDVSDPADPRLDDLRDLNNSDRRPDLPGGRGLVIAEGTYVVGRMLLSRFRPHVLLGTDARLHQLRREAAAEGWDADERAGDAVYLRTTKDVLSEVIGFRSSRDILAAADRPAPLPVEEVLDGARTLVVLEGVNDPENLGAIFRNCAALGVDGVLFGAAAGDPLYRRVVRVSMGHVLRLPFAHLPGTPTTWQRSLEDLRERGFRTVALTPSADTPLSRAVDADRVAFVLGAEGPGLTEHAMRACDVRAAIPMTDGTDSLNVATAAAVAFYERSRRD